MTDSSWMMSNQGATAWGADISRLVSLHFLFGICEKKLNLAKSNISLDEINSVLKGLLFAQEMFEESSIESFVSKYPEKYRFMTGSMKDMPDYQETLFQGSTAEGLARFGIEEEIDLQSQYEFMRFRRSFDYDIMNVKSKLIITERDYLENVCPFITNSDTSETMKRQFEEWKEGKFCKHSEEPLVLFQVGGSGWYLGEYVSLSRPACKQCTDETKKTTRKILNYRGRKFECESPRCAVLECLWWRTQNHGDRECHCPAKYGNNRYGDLCDDCVAANTYEIIHGNSAKSISRMDMAFHSGPSIETRFYMENKGKILPELPLFNEPDVGIVYLDHVAAYPYPLDPILGYRWPFSSACFITRERKSGWPSNDKIKELLATGCHLVPKRAREFGHPKRRTWMKFCFDEHFSVPMWRISFSAAEKVLAKALTPPQRKCFLLLKVFLNAKRDEINGMLKKYFRKPDDDDDDEDNFQEFNVTGFVLKHVMFWTMEKVPQEEWRFNNLYSCLIHVLNQFEEFLEGESVPHYFFGETRNLLMPELLEGTEAERGILSEKIVVLQGGIRALKSRIGMMNTINDCLNEAGIDYQWNKASSLENKELTSSFHQLKSAVEQDELKPSHIIAHHQSMINAIRTAPRRYGHGVNEDFAKFLENEISLMTKSEGCLKFLDIEEKKSIAATKRVKQEGEDAVLSRLANIIAVEVKRKSKVFAVQSKFEGWKRYRLCLSDGQSTQ